MLRKIWAHYFLKQFLEIFLFVLFSFWGLYILIDYATHTSVFFHHHMQTPWQEVIRYYLYLLSSRAEILLPLALLIASIKTICSLNTHRELVALMAGGMKSKTLMHPFLLIAYICMALLYINEQWILPPSLKNLRQMEETAKDQKKSLSSHLAAHSLFLKDGSLLIYQSFDPKTENFFDVYWIRSIDNIYRIQTLAPYRPLPMGYFVDHLVRQGNGELIQVNAYPELSFPDFSLQRENLQVLAWEPEMFSITELLHLLPQQSSPLDEKESKQLTAFYWKLTIPWLCLLAILMPAPSCLRFSRQLPIFMIYVCSLFGLLAFYMLLDAAQFMAKRQVIDPFWAICTPFLIVFSYFSWRFAKMQ